MVNIVLYGIGIILLLYVLGFGLTLFILPKPLQKYSFWLMPWVAIVFLIFVLVLVSLAGLPVSTVSAILITLLICLDIFAISKVPWRLAINLKEFLIVGLLMGMVFVVGSYPLLRYEKTLTTISLGNNDPIIYAVTADYLNDHSLNEFFRSDKNSLEMRKKGIGSLIGGGYRWGSPMLLSFFVSVFQLKGYQLEYLMQVVLFVLCLPLVYSLMKIVYKPSFLALGFALILFGFNANLLYILYHNFFGQVLFWGIGLFLLVGFFSYFFSEEEKYKHITKYDIMLGATIAALYFSYHETIIFMVLPLILLLIFRFIFKKQYGVFWNALLKIFLVLVATGAVSVINAMAVDFFQVSSINAPIGWSLFRKNLPYANPFEMMGFYSIHSFEPMPFFIAGFLSFMVIWVILNGLYASKKRIIALSFLTVYIIFYIWTSVVHHNFFAYNRAVTYTLPLVLVLFAVGMDNLFKEKRMMMLFLVIFLAGMEIFSAVKLMRRFVRERITVDASFISLEEIKKQNIQEPIYAQSIIIGFQNYWSKIWIDYFLNSDYKMYTGDNFIRAENFIPDDSLILISKYSWYNQPAMIAAKKTVWENGYYKLVRACDSDRCLLESVKPLHFVDFKTGEYQDSLLISGWSIREDGHRWSIGKKSTLRLVAEKNQTFSKLAIRAHSLQKPQTITVFANGIKVGEEGLDAEPKEYIFNIGNRQNETVHVEFQFSNIYQPIASGVSSDIRELSADFRTIELR